MEAPHDATKSKTDLLNFSGSASDMMAAMAAAGIVLPEAQDAAMKVAAAPPSAPEECADPDCTHDHDHSHGHGHDHKEEGCTDASHDHSHGHKEEKGHDHSHGHDHKDEGCMDASHDHSHGHKEEKGHDHSHGHDHKEEGCTDASHDQSHGHKEEKGHGHSHGHGHGHSDTGSAEEQSYAGRIESKLRIALPGVSHISVVDESGDCGKKIDLVVVSTTFDGKPLLARHRAVNDALSDEIPQIHALTIKTYTPTQWAEKKGQDHGGSR